MVVNQKVCKTCGNLIYLDKEKFVLIGTYQAEKVLEEGYFHWQCFNKWHNDKTKEKAQNIVKNATKQAIGIFGKLKAESIDIPNMEDEIKFG